MHRRLKRTFAWRISSIEKNRALALRDVDRAITDEVGIYTMTILQDKVRRDDEQLHNVQEEARSVRGDNWKVAIITEHQEIARELSTPAFLPTTFEEEDEDAEISDAPTRSEAKASTYVATAPASDGNAPPREFSMTL